jgi:N6-adenosine-specific RNA methylase IME4
MNEVGAIATDLASLSGFRCIVVDPPWPYKNKMGGTLFGHGRIGTVMTAEPMPYPTMSISEISSMPITKCAADGCHLYLWTTQVFLRYAYTILDSWGFKQGAVLVWSKPPKGVCGTWVCSAEFCIFARRGTLAHKRRHIGTVFQWSRGQHSAKPESFQDMVETVSPGPYLELFARRPRLGWTVWGNEVWPESQKNLEGQRWSQIDTTLTKGGSIAVTPPSPPIPPS